MNIKTKLLVIVIVAGQTLAFSQTNPVMRYISADAPMAMHVNFSAMAGKVSASSFRESAVYHELHKDSSKEGIINLFSSPNQTGMDFSSGLYVVMTNDSANGQVNNYINIYGHLKNESQFRHLIQMVAPKDSVHVYGTNSIIYKSPITIGWNNEVFVFSILKKDNAPKPTGNMEKTMDSVWRVNRNHCFLLLTPHAIDAVNSHFMETMNAPADISIWTNGSSPAFAKKKNPLAGMFKMPAMPETKKAGFIHFETGKIVIKSNSFFPHSMSEVYQQYTTPALQTDLLSRLPEDKLIGFISVAFNSAMAKEMMKKMGMEHAMDSVKKMLPFDPASVSGAFGNNVILAVMKGDSSAMLDSSNRWKKGMELLVALPIADPAKFETLKGNLMQRWDSMQQAGAMGNKLKKMKPSIKYDSKLLVVSTSPQITDAFFNNQAGSFRPQWLETFHQYPILFNLRMKTLTEFLAGKKQPGKALAGMQKVMGMFDEINIAGGQFDNDSMKGEFELRLSNHDQNALQQLFDKLNLMISKQDKAKQ